MASGAGEESNLYETKIMIGSGKDQTFNLLADTGSSWNWVKSCDKDEYAYWQNNQCPEYYFDQAVSSTLECTDKNQFI
jgi:hypothetical protein